MVAGALSRGGPGTGSITYWLITEADMLDLAVHDQAEVYPGERAEVKRSSLAGTFYRCRTQ